MSATAAWAEVQPGAAARTAVSLLGKLERGADAEVIFRSFNSRQDGPAALVQAISGTTLAAAIAGIRIAQASGLELGQVVHALTRAGSLQPVKPDLSPARRAALLSDASKRGDYDRGAAIFKRPALACVACHAIKGKGGQVGPELGTLGTFMTPAAILESLLNPSSLIKPGYESVVITLKTAAILVGTLQRRTKSAVLLRDSTGKITSVSNNRIARVDSSPVSIMPPGLTGTLRRDELVDLLHYLTHLQ